MKPNEIMDQDIRFRKEEAVIRKSYFAKDIKKLRLLEISLLIIILVNQDLVKHTHTFKFVKNRG